jgi:hypothetical protein
MADCFLFLMNILKGKKLSFTHSLVVQASKLSVIRGVSTGEDEGDASPSFLAGGHLSPPHFDHKMKKIAGRFE